MSTTVNQRVGAVRLVGKVVGEDGLRQWYGKIALQLCEVVRYDVGIMVGQTKGGRSEVDLSEEVQG